MKPTFVNEKLLLRVQNCNYQGDFVQGHVTGTRFVRLNM